MQLNQEQLREIENFAYLYIDKKDIAIVLGLADSAELSDIDSTAGKAFAKGRIKRKAQFHKNITALSDQLSSPAQAIESKLAESTYLNDTKS